MSRPLPWTDLFEAIGEERFTQIREALAAAKVDAFDQDAFTMNGAVGQLLRELMPDDAPAEAVSAYASLLHMVYLAWSTGWPVTEVQKDALRTSLAPAPALPAPALLRFSYLALPPNLVWAEPAAGEAHEPMDGAFVLVKEDRVHVLGVLGFRAGRPGFTTMEGAIRLPAPPPERRPDGRPAFASTLPAGEKAGLVSVVDEHELCALALLALAAALPA
ncbi:MAG: hypothetical protein ACHQC8_08535 [Solirubrobacterales bacterium]